MAQIEKSSHTYEKPLVLFQEIFEVSICSNTPV